MQGQDDEVLRRKTGSLRSFEESKMVGSNSALYYIPARSRSAESPIQGEAKASLRGIQAQ
jgi:hypothetical protein